MNTTNTAAMYAPRPRLGGARWGGARVRMGESATVTVQSESECVCLRERERPLSPQRPTPLARPLTRRLRRRAGDPGPRPPGVPRRLRRRRCVPGRGPGRGAGRPRPARKSVEGGVSSRQKVGGSEIVPCCRITRSACLHDSYDEPCLLIRAAVAGAGTQLSTVGVRVRH